MLALAPLHEPWLDLPWPALRMQDHCSLSSVADAASQVFSSLLISSHKTTNAAATSSLGVSPISAINVSTSLRLRDAIGVSTPLSSSVRRKSWTLAIPRATSSFRSLGVSRWIWLAARASSETKSDVVEMLDMPQSPNRSGFIFIQDINTVVVRRANLSVDGPIFINCCGYNQPQALRAYGRNKFALSPYRTPVNPEGLGSAPRSTPQI